MALKKKVSQKGNLFLLTIRMQRNDQ